MKKLCKKIGRLFYHRKIKNNECIIRILFFRHAVPLNSGHKNNAQQMIKLQVPANCHVGKYTYCANQPNIASPDTRLGSFCSLGLNISLGHGIHPINYLSSSPYLYFDILGFKDEKMVSHNEYWDLEHVEIGNDVWMGDGVFVKNGVKIGHGAVIGAHSVVTKDVPPYAIVAGVPARIIRYRFDEQIIQELLSLKWWDLEDNIIRQIPYDNLEKAILFLKEVRRQ